MKRAILFITTMVCSLSVTIADPTFTNPIIPGGHPDPSICRVGDDFYIVNSTFEYFPGLPIHHSKDLVNWELIGHGLHSESQCTPLKMFDIQQRGGIHAPTIRHHDGVFYIITTSVYSPADDSPTEMINFIITAKDPAGPWSEPHVIEGAPGIDPDIFFDDDGRAWYAGTRSPENKNYVGEGEIWLQQLDLDEWKLVGTRYPLWRGACGGTWAEGPHIYKHDGKYYLLIAEGGTSFNHAVMIASSDRITGPYESNPRNPILTTRHLSYNNWVHSTGHADMVQLADGRWYAVSLGIRGDINRGSNMGRETHLIPVEWEREPFEWKAVKNLWPVFAPLTGRVDRTLELPFEGKTQYYNDSFDDNFDSQTLDLEWNFRRPPLDKTYSLSEKAGFLRLYLKPSTFELRGRYSAMGVRQKESDFEYSARMLFNPKADGAEAGISLFLQDDNYINMTIVNRGKKRVLQLQVCKPEQSPYVAKEVVLSDYKGEMIFKVVSQGDKYNFYYAKSADDKFEHMADLEADLIICKGYTGAYVGLYATSNGKSSKEYADFDWIFYKGHVR